MAQVPYIEHQVVKPEVLTKAAVGLLEQDLTIANLFTKKSHLDFAGADNDTVNMVVPGVLPFRKYAWRNDRTEPIKYDTYKERKIAVSFGGRMYSAVQLTDEQHDMDLQGWSPLLENMTRAVSRGLNYGAIETLEKAPYEVVIGDAEQDLRGAVLEARRVLNAFHAPGTKRILVAGSEFEMELLRDKDMVQASNTSESRAESALANATIGRIAGFTVVTDPTIEPTAAYALDSTGFIFINGAPQMPRGAVAGSTASANGVSMRLLFDYDHDRQMDRASVTTFYGFNYLKDPLVGVDKATGQEFVSADEYFVRGVKLEIGGESKAPEPTSDLAKATGIDAVWTPRP